MDFSTTVDMVASRLGQPNNAETYAPYVNEAIRFVERSLDGDLTMREGSVACTSRNYTAAWEIPDVARFISLVYAEDFAGDPVKMVRPSASLGLVRDRGSPVGYRSGRTYTFINVQNGVNFSYQEHSPWFTYYAPAERPMQFDTATGCWSYRDERNDIAPGFDEYQARLVTSDSLQAYGDLIRVRALHAYAIETNDPIRADLATDYQRLWSQYTSHAAR